jgi:hypothetical protein
MEKIIATIIIYLLASSSSSHLSYLNFKIIHLSKRAGMALSILKIRKWKHRNKITP